MDPINDSTLNDQAVVESTTSVVSMQLIVTAIVLLISILIAVVLLRQRGGSKQSSKPVVIITGPSGAGKTALFSAWTDRKPLSTVTSLSANESQFGSESGLDDIKATLIDLPGHIKLEHLTKEQLASPGLKAVVFVVDAASGVAGISAAARRLYTVLAKTDARGIPVLVAANKYDLFNTFSTKKITTLLQDEINELRQVRTKTVGEVGNEDDEVPWIGLEEKFQFDHLEYPVKVIDGSVLSGRTKNWSTWLSDAL